MTQVTRCLHIQQSLVGLIVLLLKTISESIFFIVVKLCKQTSIRLVATKLRKKNRGDY